MSETRGCTARTCDFTLSNARINGQVRKSKGAETIRALAPIGALRRSNKANTESTVIQNAIEIWIDRG